MNKVLKQLGILLFVMSLTPTSLFAQSHKIENGVFVVEGTSTLHDWTMESKQVNGTVKINMSEHKISSIEQFDVKVKAESLESGKSSMDKIAYEALKSEDNPIISFNLKKVKSLTYSGSTAEIVVNGVLTIAGVSKTVELSGSAVKNDGYLKIEGSKKIKMTDYEIEPPTAVFGTIKTGDEININYKLNLKTQ